MKLTQIAILVSVFLSGCSTFSSKDEVQKVDIAPVQALADQRLSTTFRKDGVKLGWSMKGELKSVEVTGFAAAAGNSQLQEDATCNLAEMDARSKLQQFLNETVTSTRVANVMVKNIEKAFDRTKQKIKGMEEETITMNDAEADQAAKKSSDPDDGETNFAIRNNANTTVRTLTTKITGEAKGIQRGVALDSCEATNDGRHVRAVIRWDGNSAKAADQLRKAFK
ncbi:MAG: hypothetical protein ACOVLB_03785 [Candidatus Nanopelagicus sp.]